jgi:hypothetical protein
VAQFENLVALWLKEAVATIRPAHTHLRNLTHTRLFKGPRTDRSAARCRVLFVHSSVDDFTSFTPQVTDLRYS